MFSSVRKYLTYANVVATIALVFAMSGGALAASHYLITKTSQIAPKVRKALAGRAGAKGATGATGSQGKEGAAGKEGSAGKEGAAGREGSAGKEGPAGPFPGVLPRGITLRGNYNLRFVASAGGQFLANSISFGFQFASAPEKHYVPPATTGTGPCAGGTVKEPTAAPGNICFYSLTNNNTMSPGAFDETTPFGSKVELESAASGDAYDFGTWAATSP
jgi:hypothetical protein